MFMYVFKYVCHLVCPPRIERIERIECMDELKCVCMYTYEHESAHKCDVCGLVDMHL